MTTSPVAEAKKRLKPGRKRIEGLVPLTINIPSELKEKLEKKAKTQKTSVTYQIISRIEKTFVTEVDEDDDTLSSNVVVQLEGIKKKIDTIVDNINKSDTLQFSDKDLSGYEKSFFGSFKNYLDNLVESERKLLLSSVSHAIEKGDNFLDIILKAIVVDRDQKKQV